ncbi:MAG: DUF1343 domain-containing protein [Muribaculaceae bacterium]|jgi:uncharacterized protein YbbC (DUF1343 family)|nr:DUF1343 domain-containing protein [Muribaculaceae bacterium]
MKKTIIAILSVAVAIAATAQVKPGVEVLRDRNFDILQGKRVGLITNPSGVDNTLKSTVDILSEAPGVRLTALYGPEHGVRGDVHAGDNVGNSVDAATGVPVYSIYGKYRKPTAEMLDDVDVLVYDIQDNGCRSFTFISTMGLAMQTCAELGKEFVVLDRPNPAGANKIEGCIVEDSCFSFVSQFPIPYLYGLTPGELATYLNEEGLLPGGVKARLTVVPMEGYDRKMSFADTGMPWVLPSPHQPNAESALYYPATGILGELYYVSIGVGYTMPFKLVAADWVDAAELNRRLNALEIPGVMFRPIHIKPFYSTGKGENLQGVEIYVTDAEAAPLTLVQFYVMQELAAMYPDRRVMDTPEAAKRFGMFDKVTGSKQIRRLFTKRHSVADMAPYWNKDVEPFRAASSKYHLYK